jgi:hypothetical protein
MLAPQEKSAQNNFGLDLKIILIYILNNEDKFKKKNCFQHKGSSKVFSHNTHRVKLQIYIKVIKKMYFWNPATSSSFYNDSSGTVHKTYSSNILYRPVPSSLGFLMIILTLRHYFRWLSLM